MRALRLKWAVVAGACFAVACLCWPNPTAAWPPPPPGAGGAPADFRGKPASELVRWLGEPTKVHRVAAALHLYEWHSQGSDSLVPPSGGLVSEVAFFVRPDGTVVGPAVSTPNVAPTPVAEIVAILGPATDMTRSMTTQGIPYTLYTWIPVRPRRGHAAGAGGVEMRLRLTVDAAGIIRGWN